MAADSSSSSKETVAVVFLAEASLAVGHEFCKKLTDYSTSLIKRLHDNHLHAQFKIAFVSYGPSDTAPSPILCKRFFSDRPAFFKEMMEDVSHFGIGLTNSGGGKGMAALDGFAATLELFDILFSLALPRDGSTSSPFISHIIHVAASPPDSSLHPIYNDNAALDNIDWDSLPHELKKASFLRNINYTTISLVPGLSRFQDLHSAVVTGGSAPWFTVYSPHVVLLASFPPPLQSKATPPKRVNEQPIERAPDPKRPRIQPNTESPKPAPKAPTPSVSHIPTVASHTQPIRPAPPPQQHKPGPPQLPTLSPAQVSQFSERLKHAATELSALHNRFNTAKLAGDIKLVEELTKEMREKFENNGKILIMFKSVINSIQNTVPQQLMNQLTAQAQAFYKLLIASQQMIGPNTTGNPLSPDNNHPTPSNMPMPPSGSMAPNGPNPPPQIQHIRSFSDTNFPMNPAAIPSPPNNMPQQNGGINAQMLKMLEQNRARQQQQQQQAQAQAQAQHLLQSQQLQPPPPPQVGGLPNPMLSGNPMHNIAPSIAMPNRLAVPPNMPLAPGAPMLSADGQQRQPVWQGPMLWSGVGAMGKKAMQTLVAAYFMQGTECHEHTWPIEMVLAPTRENLVTEAELQMWIHRFKPALCQIIPQNNVADPDRNNTSYKQLVSLLTERKIYATVAWTTPTGGQTKNALLIPANGKIIGAFFALTGLPDLPKPMAMLLNEFNISPSALQQIQTLPADRVQNYLLNQLRNRNVFLMFLRAYPQQQQQQQQQQRPPQLQPSNNTGFPPNMVANQNFMAAMLAAQRSQAGPPLNMNAPQPSVPASLARFGMGNQNNFSDEIMQSFVQRSGDTGNNMNLQG
ncbi:hypothetical protein JR316_0006044 [Psilocybe cubensis]|uniref:Uncharacterized protein n=2 Tax=Psilocybe cubensis TaxID=181762 RepID=A0A8H8CM75_PSICU|nr:hypothetical protein JR316_0006044 [Psilocybe cubensis]KAH9481517.1 hypothetical protein JR316_0006044 [Psilocybe cubensis]